MINKSKLLFAIQALFFVVVIVITVVRIILIFNYDPVMVTGEDGNVWNIIKVINGNLLYTTPNEFPFETFPYTPISQYPVIWICKLFNIVDVRYVLITGRFLNFVYELALSALVYIFSVNTTKLDKKTSLLLASFVFVFSYYIAFAIRPDALTNLISFISFALIVYLLISESPNRKKILYIAAAGLVSAISFYSKQSGIQIPFIILITLIIIKEYRNSLLFALSYAISFGVIFLIFYSVYGHNFFISIYSSLNNGVSFLNAFYVLNRYIMFYNVLPIVFIILFSYYILFSQNKIKIYLGLVGAGLFAFAFITSLKLGSGASYYSLFTTWGIFSIGFQFYDFYSNNKLLYSYFFIILIVFFYSGMFYHYNSKFLFYPKNNYYNSKAFYKSEYPKLKNGEYIFTNNKYLKLFFQKKSIFPNEDYYFISPFDYSKFNHKSLIYLYIDGTPEENQILTKILKIKSEYVFVENKFGINIYKRIAD